jgi:DNA-directed RNA polymerase I, II, and III subunit RPABC2
MQNNKRNIKKTKKSNDSDSDVDVDTATEKLHNSYDATVEKHTDVNNISVDDTSDDEWDEGDDNINDEIDNDNDGQDNDNCVYNVNRKSKDVVEITANIDDDDDGEDDDNDDFSIDENNLNPDIYIAPEDRRSNPYITKYEKVRLIGERTTQIAHGAKPMINGVEGFDPRIITQLEFESKKIPIKIIRPLPNGKKEVWHLEEMYIKKEHIVYGLTGNNLNIKEISKINDKIQEGGGISGHNRNFLFDVKKSVKSQ